MKMASGSQRAAERDENRLRGGEVIERLIRIGLIGSLAKDYKTANCQVGKIAGFNFANRKAALMNQRTRMA